MVRPKIAVWPVLFVCLLARSAAAQEDTRKLEAEPLYNEGLQLVEKKQDEAAAERFLRAFTLYPSANIAFQLAETEQRLGRNIEAIRHYRYATKIETLHPNSRQKAREHIRELEAKLGRVLVRAPAGTALMVDGVPWKDSLEEPIDLAVGSHALGASLEGKQRQVTVTAAAGKLETVAINFEDATVTAPPSTSGSSSGWSTGKIVVVSGLGAGAVAGVVAAIVFHGSATSAVDDAKSLPPTGDCRGSTSADCNRARDLQSDRDTADTLTTMSIVASGVLAAGAVAAAVFWPGPRREAARITPLVGTGFGGASLSFGF